jgi:5-methylcytosine-specific restriction protein A
LCYNSKMSCITLGCHRKPDRNKECSYHLRIRLYGFCKNGCTTPAQAKHGMCSRCVLRNGKPRTRIPLGKWINNEKQRFCWSCKEIKEILNFPKSKKSPHGYGGMCKNCLIIRNNKYNPIEVFKYAEKNLKQGKSCARCLSKNKLEVDHIVPLSKGGDNSINNLQILCSSCNKKKGNRSAIDYRIML